MCYIIESQHHFDFHDMTVTIEKCDMDINFVRVWITSNNNFLVATTTLKSSMVPFQITIPFGEIQLTRITFEETIIKPLNCKTSDTEYVSEWQCFVNIFIDENFSPCPIKCLPIQRKGFHYVNKSCSVFKCYLKTDKYIL